MFECSLTSSFNVKLKFFFKEWVMGIDYRCLFIFGSFIADLFARRSRASHSTDFRNLFDRSLLR